MSQTIIDGVLPNPLCKRFGATIRGYRENSRMTLPALAKASGVSKGLISKIEHGHGNPSLTTIHKLSRGLRVGVSELLAG